MPADSLTSAQERASRTFGRVLAALPAKRYVRAFVILSLVAIFFLWKPLATGGYYAAGDVSGLSDIASTPGTDVGRVPQIDVPLQFLPWMKFSLSEIHAGRLPGWNPYNNAGIPHFANIQTSTFSPFDVPFYVFSMRLALIISTYLVLVTSGMCMYGLMRHLKTSDLAALVSAFAYTYCGFMVFWLRWTPAPVGALLPGILWASSALCRAEGWRQVVRRGLALALILAAAIFAGHPETLLFGLVPAILFYLTVSVFRRGGIRVLALKALQLAGACLAAGALASVQLLPFVEYLSQSSSSRSREVEAFQSAKWAHVIEFPLAHGTPMMRYAGPYGLVFDFHHITVMAIGAVALTLAAVGLVSPIWKPCRVPLFFGGVILASVLYISNMFGLARLLMNLPVLSVTVPARIAIVWSLCVAVLAGFGVDALAANVHQRNSLRTLFIAGVSVAAVAGTALFAFRAWQIYDHESYRSPALRALAWDTLKHHLLFVTVTLLVGVALIVLCAVTRQTWIQRVAILGVVLVVFLQGPFMMRGQEVTTSQKRFMNYSSRLRQITERIGDRQTAWVDGAQMMPNMNLGIPAYSPDSYDVIGIPRYTRLYRKALGVSQDPVVNGVQAGMLSGPYAPSSLSGLQVMGVARVVTNRGYPFATSSFLASRAQSMGGTTRFKVRWSEANPREMVLYTAGIDEGVQVQVTLSGTGVAGQERTRAEVHGTLAVLSLPASLPRSGIIHAIVTQPGGTRTTTADGKVTGARVVSTSVPGLRLLDSIGGYQIFKVPGTDGFLTSPARAIAAQDNAAAFRRVTEPLFDPAAEAVVETTAANVRDDGPLERNGRVSVTRFQPGNVAAMVDRATEGYVVFNQNDYPGWHATVNGRAVQVVRANSTFMAVKVPAGTSRVRFWFESGSMEAGGLISLGMLVIVSVLALSTFIRRPEPR